MPQQKLTGKMFETDRIDWTEDTLLRRIAETRTLIDRIDANDDLDEDYEFIRTMLADDLLCKEHLLAEMAHIGQVKSGQVKSGQVKSG